MQVGLWPWELEAKALHGQAKEVCSYAKKKEGKEKEQGNPGAREEVSFHTEPQRWNHAKSGRATHSVRSSALARGWGAAKADMFAVSFHLLSSERFSALLSCYLENIYLPYLVITVSL